jgi:hypothetical protein
LLWPTAALLFPSLHHHVLWIALSLQDVNGVSLRRLTIEGTLAAIRRF